MAIFHDLRLMTLAVLMLASQLDSASATVELRNLKGSKLSGDFGNKPDPYVLMYCNGQEKVARKKEATSDPDWKGQVFTFSSCKSGHKLKVEVWDEDPGKDDKLGSYEGNVGKGSSNPIKFSAGKGTIQFTYDVK
ncbi:Perforin-1 [Anabarilius grahami]|uniref:Perforin-1 n=1 Tax=Anabarilius grahami TaxID=495550 RepID=A0A3N0XDA6_ANAGA|nr:Perforin-1 [Anabarilius grahami]